MKNVIPRVLPWAVGAVLALGMQVGAQGGPNDQGPSIDRAVKLEIIDSLSTALNEYYVFPEVAKQMEKHARSQLKKGAYDSLTTVGQFTRALTEDLRTICHDGHFRVRFAPTEQIEAMFDTTKQQSPWERLEEARHNNFWFEEIKMLPGNIGYLKFNQFSGFPEARETAVAAMNFLGNCDALIIDLRDNGGGDPIMIGLISSYFFDHPVHLNTFYVRKTDSLQQYWTSAYVDGRRMDKTPLYVLTSRRSFSGAEEFTYNLKNLKRATIIGETTGGGAHPVDVHVFPNLQVLAGVPFGRAINPISGTNWEGTGVEPDIKCEASQAFDRAKLEALKGLRDHTNDSSRSKMYDWAIKTLEAQLHPVALTETEMVAYIGDFGPRHVTIEDGVLVYQREKGPKYRMTPMGEDLFCFADLGYFRIKYVKDNLGKVIAIEGHYDDGMVDRNEKTS